ncbi:chorismate mutase [Candidatus Peregrinibacteria bacterium]|nr:chorismate mutase [Candidatus Peregrinibacteria bacterium]
MQKVRNEINKIDKEIISLLSKRMKLAIKIGKMKKAEGLPIRVRKREGEIMDMYLKKAKKLGLNTSFIKKLFSRIFRESRRIQRS